MPTILVADDQEDILEAFRLLLKPEGYEIRTASSPTAARRLVCKQDFDLVIIDLNYERNTTSGKEGLDLIEELSGLDETMPILVMTAWGTIDLAVEAMRRGARDFIQKPWDNAKVLATVNTQLALSQALRSGRRLQEENRALTGNSSPHVVAQSPSMRRVMDLIKRVAPSDANVLITGENGTGKGLMARVIHSRSARSAAPFITLNTGGLAEGVFESELFGHVKGAFTDAKTDRAGRFELADGGTLFLDEIGNVPMAQQAKLLRVVETGEFERVGASKTLHTSARIISATNADLREDVVAGRFRQDLLYRLNTIEICLPSLRDRPEDILRLAEEFLSQHAQKYRRSVGGFENGAREALTSYPWPGNVRELSHVIERAVLMTNRDLIRTQDLSLTSAPENRQLDAMSLEEVEAFLVAKALERHGGNVSKAAEALGLSRSSFYRRMEKYGI